MTIPRNVFVQAVKSCIGTPTKHGGRLIGAGLDCVGIPLCALALCGVHLPEPPPYGNPPGSGALFAQLLRHCEEVPVEDREEGDLFAVLWKGEPRHVMVFVGHDDHGRMLAVHARGRSGRVVLEPMTRGYRISSAWRLREVV